MIAVTDEQLVVEVKEGNIEVFEILVRRYQGKLSRFVCCFISDREMVEDIVQDTFFNLYKTIDRIDTTKKISPYLFQIAKNTAITYLRKERFKVRLEEIEIAGNGQTIYESFAKKEIAALVKKAISKLSFNFRQVIRLYYFDNM